MEEKVISTSSSIKIFFKNLVLELLISILLLLVLSILLSTTNLSESVISSAIIFISSFSILLGGFLSSRKMKIKGIIIGVLQGISYMMILYIFSSLLSHNFSLGKESIVMILVGIMCGGIGGIIGANLKWINVAKGIVKM